MMRTFLFIIIALLPTLGMAGSFEVAPTSIILPAGARYAALYITNRGKDPVSAQIEAFDWQQKDAKDILTPSDSLNISPPMVQLLPGRRQTVRLAVDPGEASTKERSFRLVVSQIPDPQGTKDGVQVLLQFNIPVFSAIDKSPPKLEWNLGHTPDGFLLTVHNAGSSHVKLSGLTITAPGGNDISVTQDTFSYVLADASHAWKLQLPPTSAGQVLKLKAKNENEGMVYSSFTMTH